MKGLIIVGAGGCARELFYNLQGSCYTNFVFVDENATLPTISIGGRTFRIIKDWDFKDLNFKSFLLAIGNPSVKRRLFDLAVGAGLEPEATFIHPTSLVQDATLGPGGYVAPGCVVTTNIRVGLGVLLNYNSTVGHDTVIGDFVTINPGSHISGNVKIGSEVTIGAGTIVREGLSICSNVTTGAQAAVVNSIHEAGVIVGVPAKPLRT